MIDNEIRLLLRAIAIALIMRVQTHPSLFKEETATLSRLLAQIRDAEKHGKETSS